MGKQGTTAVRIGLHEVSGLRWPKQPLTGDGARENTAVPLPRLPWSNAAIEVPLGASAARGVARVTTLRRIFGYGVAPLIIVLFVVGGVSVRSTVPAYVIAPTAYSLVVVAQYVDAARSVANCWSAGSFV